MLTQRAIDTSIKAYELNSVELCQQVRRTDGELRKLQHSIGDRGRTLLAAGTPVDSNASMACCTLRIYSTLRIMCTAAVEISQNTMAILESGHVTESLATEVTMPSASVPAPSLTSARSPTRSRRTTAA